MHHIDLSLMGFAGESVRPFAVGWLEPDHEYSRGEVGVAVVSKLAELLYNPWQSFAAVGFQTCGFCRFTGGPSTFRLIGRENSPEVIMGSANLWLPAKDRLYYAPSLILHYVDAHGYSPPIEFQQAVMDCPAMRSMDYLREIIRHGVRRLQPPEERVALG